MAATQPVVHAAAREGFGSAVIERYEKGRPEHHEGFVLKLLHDINILPANDSTKKVVLELGCGTGKYTRVLHKVLQENGVNGNPAADLIISDPADMSEAVKQQMPGLEFHRTSADNLSAIGDASVDAIIAAQAFHWFADAPSVREILRVLKPGGYFAVVWNMRDRGEVAPWTLAFEQLMDSYYHADTPRQHSGQWRTALAVPDFGPTEGCRLEVPGGYVADEAKLLQYVLSISDISRRPEDEKQAIVDKFRQLIRGPDVPFTIRESDGAKLYCIPMFTEMYWVQKR